MNDGCVSERLNLIKVPAISIGNEHGSCFNARHTIAWWIFSNISSFWKLPLKIDNFVGYFGWILFKIRRKYATRNNINILKLVELKKISKKEKRHSYPL